MGVHKGTYDLHKEGSRDAARHQEKLKDAFKKKMKDVISEENIITQGNKKVKIPIRSLDQYRFVFDQKKLKHTGQGDGSTEQGDIIWQKKKQGKGEGGKAGNEEGEEIYEAEVDLDDLVDMMLEDLKLPKLDPKKKADISVPETVWNDVAKKGAMSNLQKKRTVIENMKRNAKDTGKAYFGDIKQEDLRFKTWNEKLRPITSAVVFAIMDVSGSMSQDKKYIARSFYWWMVQFLKRKYENVEVVFISHTTTAKVVSEQDFFHTMESGGTMISSGYKKAQELIKHKYNPNLWNIFTFHFSDGETWGDEQDCVKVVKELCEVSNMVGYGEIKLNEWETDWGSMLELYRKEVHSPKFVQALISKKEDIYPVLKRFFGEEE